MTNIPLDETTARELLAAATSKGMSVDEFVRAHLLPDATNGTHADPLLGSMADEASLLDEVISDALASRETDPLRYETDG